MARHDIIAPIYYARRLAEKLQPVARMVDLHGGHLVSHERTKEVFLLSYVEIWHDFTISLQHNEQFCNRELLLFEVNK